VRQPVDFIVTRCLLSDAELTPAAIARRCDIRVTSAIRAYKNLQSRTGLRPARLFQHLRAVKERPHWTSLLFRIPNPEQWARRYARERWFSGEVAAALDGFDLVPERWLVYLRAGDMEAAVAAAQDEFALVAKPSAANMVFRVADPWMHLDPASNLVERGQRLLDYWESDHVQLTAELMHG